MVCYISLQEHQCKLGKFLPESAASTELKICVCAEKERDFIARAGANDLLFCAACTAACSESVSAWTRERKKRNCSTRRWWWCANFSSAREKRRKRGAGSKFCHSNAYERKKLQFFCSIRRDNILYAFFLYSRRLLAINRRGWGGSATLAQLIRRKAIIRGCFCCRVIMRGDDYPSRRRGTRMVTRGLRSCSQHNGRERGTQKVGSSKVAFVARRINLKRAVRGVAHDNCEPSVQLSTLRHGNYHQRRILSKKRSRSLPPNYCHRCTADAKCGGEHSFVIATCAAFRWQPFHQGIIRSDTFRTQNNSRLYKWYRGEVLIWV